MPKRPAYAGLTADPMIRGGCNTGIVRTSVIPAKKTVSTA
jgi:hypothetical protein